MHRIISSIDRWGPGVIAVIALIAMLYREITHEREMSYVRGRMEGVQNQIDTCVQREGALRLEVQTWQAYVVVLGNRMTAHEIEIPDAPRVIITNQRNRKR